MAMIQWIQVVRDVQQYGYDPMNSAIHDVSFCLSRDSHHILLFYFPIV